MKKQDIMHFFDEHKTELICLGVGIGIGAYAVYRHYLGPICANEHSAITTGCNTTTEAIKTINQKLAEVGDAEKILWWIEKF